MNDEYISREEAIDKMRSLKSSYRAKNEWDKGYDTAIAQAFEYIKRVPVADVQAVKRWISVNDRLPDAIYDCLVWYSCDTAFGKSESLGIAHCSRCDWDTKHLDGDNIEVLYWMPLPEPPKDGDAE